MTQRDDILLDDSQELEFLGGDFLLGVSDQQHIEHILTAKKGQYYQNPLVGLGIVDYSNATIDRQVLRQDIKIQLKADNYRPIVTEINEKFEIFIDAEPLTI